MKNVGSLINPGLIIIRLIIISAVVILYIHYFFPQSWGFYTIESNIPLYDIYAVKKGIAEKESLIINNMNYGMGMSRKGKLLYSELYHLIEFKNPQWRVLHEDSIDYITKQGDYTFIPANKEYGTLKGDFLITKTGRPTYSALKGGQPFKPSKQYILAHIR